MIPPLAQTLKTAGYRLTPQRIAICDLLQTATDHPSAQMLYVQLQPRFPTMSLTTVYNTLDALVKLGAIKELGALSDNGMRYEPDLTPHINLTCTICHQILDLPSKHIPSLDQEISDRSGFEIQGSRLVYYGFCRDCQRHQHTHKKEIR